jgi:hypothetical protein
MESRSEEGLRDFKRSLFTDEEIEPDFGATFASSQVEGSAARKCFHYA